MHESWYDRLRVQLQVVGLELITRSQVEPDFVPFETLFGHHEPYLLAAGRLDAVIESDAHGDSNKGYVRPRCDWPVTFSWYKLLSTGRRRNRCGASCHELGRQVTAEKRRSTPDPRAGMFCR